MLLVLLIVLPDGLTELREALTPPVELEVVQLESVLLVVLLLVQLLQAIDLHHRVLAQHEQELVPQTHEEARVGFPTCLQLLRELVDETAEVYLTEQ